jgi:MFS superfamily sulfate permease-like transporter
VTSSSSSSGSFRKDILAVTRTVAHAMLAAIGVMVIARQAHAVVGVVPESERPLALLFEIPSSVAHADPAVAIVGLAALLIFVAIRRKRPRDQVAVQVLVLIVAVALGLGLDLEQVSLAALAAVLVHVVAQLTATVVLRQARERTQLAVFWATLTATLLTNLLIGVAVGLGLAMVLHLVRKVQP